MKPPMNPSRSQALSTAGKQRKMRHLVLPMLGIGIAYTALFDLPISRSLSEHTTKREKLTETFDAGKTDAAANSVALERAIETERELREQLQSLKTPDTRLTKTVEPTPRRLASSVALISEITSVFSRNNLRCLESQPVGSSDTSATNKKATSVAQSTAIPSTHLDSVSESSARRKIRVTLLGRFAEMQSALQEMQAALTCVSIVSLEMEASTSDDGDHQWILVILI